MQGVAPPYRDNLIERASSVRNLNQPAKSGTRSCLLAHCLHTLKRFASLIALLSTHSHNIRPSELRPTNTSLKPLTEETFKAESLQTDFLRAFKASSRHKETNHRRAFLVTCHAMTTSAANKQPRRFPNQERERNPRDQLATQLESN